VLNTVQIYFKLDLRTIWAANKAQKFAVMKSEDSSPVFKMFFASFAFRAIGGRSVMIIYTLDVVVFGLSKKFLEKIN
jgi:hypothetical protein